MSDHGTARVCFVSAASFLRGLPLFVAPAPRTPLRALGVIAFDMLHVLRYARPLPRAKVAGLSLFLDFQGCANAAWDHKRLCASDYDAIRSRLESYGLGACVAAYLSRLDALEGTRPSVNGGRRRFEDARSYREGVARLSLATAAAIALTPAGGDEDIREAYDDDDVAMLFRILMQCQVIDDVWDYADDAEAGLPSFLTVSRPLTDAVALTADAARSYASTAPARTLLPLRVALWVATAASALVLARFSPAPHHHRRHTNVKIGS
jgi:hypothetical protein